MPYGVNALKMFLVTLPGCKNVQTYRVSGKVATEGTGSVFSQ